MFRACLHRLAADEVAAVDCRTSGFSAIDGLAASARARTRPGRPAFPPSRRRAGNAGDGERDAGARVGERAGRHFQRRLARHGAMRVERRGGNAEHLHLGFVGIGDEAAVDHGGRAGNVGQRAMIMPPVQDSAVATMMPRRAQALRKLLGQLAQFAHSGNCLRDRRRWRWRSRRCLPRGRRSRASRWSSP